MNRSPNVDKGHVNLKPIPDILECCKTGSSRTGWEMMGTGFVDDVYLFIYLFVLSLCVLSSRVLPSSVVFVCLWLFAFFLVVVVLPNSDVIRYVSCLLGYCPSPTRALEFDKNGVGHDGMGWDAVSTHPSTPLVVTKQLHKYSPHLILILIVALLHFDQTAGYKLTLIVYRLLANAFEHCSVNSSPIVNAEVPFDTVTAMEM